MPAWIVRPDAGNGLRNSEARRSMVASRTVRAAHASATAGAASALTRTSPHLITTQQATPNTTTPASSAPGTIHLREAGGAVMLLLTQSRTEAALA